MDTLTLTLGTLGLALIGVTWQAARLRNERRDVVFLAVTTGLLGAGTAASVVL